MLTGPWAFFLGSPMKILLWVGNRLATWTGLLVLWQKLKHLPNRTRRFLLIGALLNVVSLLALVGVLWLAAHRHH